jgi:hypothetical protein
MLAVKALEVEAFTVSEFVVELLVVVAFNVAKFAEFPKITVKYADKPETTPVTKFSTNELVVVELVVVESPAMKKLVNEFIKLEVVEKIALEVAKVKVEFWVIKFVPELILNTEVLA